jgi:hypothetical protein
VLWAHGAPRSWTIDGISCAVSIVEFLVSSIRISPGAGPHERVGRRADGAHPTGPAASRRGVRTVRRCRGGWAAARRAVRRSGDRVAPAISPAAGRGSPRWRPPSALGPYTPCPMPCASSWLQRANRRREVLAGGCGPPFNQPDHDLTGDGGLAERLQGGCRPASAVLVDHARLRKLRLCKAARPSVTGTERIWPGADRPGRLTWRRQLSGSATASVGGADPASRGEGGRAGDLRRGRGGGRPVATCRAERR